MPKRKRSDLPDERELNLSPSIWLEWYEQHLKQVLSDFKKRRSLNREDVEILLFDRSDLERTIRASPKALTPAMRQKLSKLDSWLRELAPFIKIAIPDLAEIRKGLNVPKSHWWWFLDEEAETN